VARGTRIELKLKQATRTFADKAVIEGLPPSFLAFGGVPVELESMGQCTEARARSGCAAVALGILRKYSNFVGFPILLNGDKLNTIQPLWTLPKEAVTEDQHKGAPPHSHPTPPQPCLRSSWCG